MTEKVPKVTQRPEMRDRIRALQTIKGRSSERGAARETLRERRGREINREADGNTEGQEDRYLEKQETEGHIETGMGQRVRDQGRGHSERKGEKQTGQGLRFRQRHWKEPSPGAEQS